MARRRRHDLAAAFGYAFEGLAAAWRSEPNVRIHALLTGLALIAGGVLRLSLGAWALILFAIALVVSAELMNAAVESIVDLVSPGVHPLAKRAKDIAAAAVLVAAFGAAGIGALVFLDALAHAGAHGGGVL